MKTQQHKQVEVNFVRVFSIVFLFSSLLLMYYALNLFWAGFHNVDLGMNMKVFEAKHNQSLVDLGSDMKTRTSAGVYILGLEQQKESMNLLFPSAILFGACLSYIIWRRK